MDDTDAQAGAVVLLRGRTFQRHFGYAGEAIGRDSLELDGGGSTGQESL